MYEHLDEYLIKMSGGEIPKGAKNKYKVKNEKKWVVYPGYFYYILNMKLENYKMSLDHKMKEISFSGRMNEWEKGFLDNVSKLPKPTQKQKDLINKMFQKYILKPSGI